MEQQLANNNTNGGGSFIEQGAQQINVQSLGLYKDIQDIENTVIKTQTGASIRVKDLGIVTQGPRIRLGQIGRATLEADGTIVDNPDTVEGIVLLQKGADSDPVLQGIHDEVRKLNSGILPRGVKVVPFLDRSQLVKFTVTTVENNLAAGVVLVSIVLFLFLGNVRGAIVVALTIPFALLVAAIGLNLIHVPANLLSLGALDFGMVVDGSVVMIENIVRHLSHDDVPFKPSQRIREAAHEVQRPVFFARGIIITSYLPIFTLQAVEGRLFRPMAWTVCFALFGALLFAILVAPVSSLFLFSKGATEWQNPLMTWLTKHYRTSVGKAIDHRFWTVGIAALLFAFGIYLSVGGPIGSEFLPHLDEGSIWVRGTLPPSEGPTASIDFTNKARLVMASFPEVTQVVSQTGRPDDGTDTTGFFDTEYFVDLKPMNEWRPVFHGDKEKLIAAMDKQLEQLSRRHLELLAAHLQTTWKRRSPASRASSRSSSTVTICAHLESKADDIQSQMQTRSRHRRSRHLPHHRPAQFELRVDRDAAARWGINVSDIQDAIQTAVGSTALTQVQQGEARYDVTLRYEQQYRDTREAIENVRLLAPSGERVSLAQLTKVSTDDGAEEIYREGGQRYIAIKYSVRGRDLGSTVEEAIGKVTGT